MTRKRLGRSLPRRVWVGWREWVALPALGIGAVKAKLDTGAATSALHAIHIRRLRENGVDRVRFDIHPEQRNTDITIRCVADLLEERWVTSSTGHRERRYVVRTPMLIAGLHFPIEITLTNRDTMGFRMLIGRRAMKRRLLVDPSASYLAGAADSDRVARVSPARPRGARAGPDDTRKT